jgi:hypothetical protein
MLVKVKPKSISLAKLRMTNSFPPTGEGWDGGENVAASRIVKLTMIEMRWAYQRQPTTHHVPSPSRGGLGWGWV